jgi:hypothetical protein
MLLHTIYTLTSLSLQVTMLRRCVRPVGLLQTVERIIVTRELAFPLQSETAREVTVLCDIPFNTECLALPIRPLYPSVNCIGRWVRLLGTKCVACVGNRALISRASVTSEGRRIELVRVVAYLQGISEIDVGRERVEWALLGRCHLHVSGVI